MIFTGKQGMALCAGVLSSMIGTGAQASFQIVNVDAEAAPWVWSDTLNSAYRFGPGANGTGVPDYSAPVSIKLADLGIGAGGSLYLNFIDGLTSAFGGEPVVDNNGYIGIGFKDGAPGPGGQILPSHYYPAAWGTAAYPSNPSGFGIFLQALLGALTDDNGSIIQLFSLGTVSPDANGDQLYTSGVSLQVPVGATYVQFGLNDDIFANNTGSLNVCVSSADGQCAGSPAPVPAPAAAWLFGAGLAAVAGFGRGRNRP